jgi:hypothetical protein
MLLSIVLTKFRLGVPPYIGQSLPPGLVAPLTGFLSFAAGESELANRGNGNANAATASRLANDRQGQQEEGIG